MLRWSGRAERSCVAAPAGSASSPARAMIPGRTQQRRRHTSSSPSFWNNEAPASSCKQCCTSNIGARTEVAGSRGLSTYGRGALLSSLLCQDCTYTN